MDTKDLILRRVRTAGSVKTAEIVSIARISRQAAAKHLRELCQAGKLLKEGSTHNARYIPWSAGKAKMVRRVKRFSSYYHTRGLQEDRVFEQSALALGLRRALSKQAFEIARYAFTEMLNNAIEHSGAARVSVELVCQLGQFEFTVRDRGIGAFESIRKKFGFKDHWESVEHLLKGKQTTDPERHTGQGVFFTSKIADRFILKSARLRLEVDNRRQDTFLEETKAFKGTEVRFSVKQKSRKNLKELFDRFSNEDYEFDKTVVQIRLTKSSSGYVSRSEAKRLLWGLEKFKRIVLDFKNVPAIGQGFADEIFRVFLKTHPGVQIEPIHMVPAVEFMVRRAQRGVDN